MERIISHASLDGFFKKPRNKIIMAKANEVKEKDSRTQVRLWVTKSVPQKSLQTWYQPVLF